MKLTSNDIRQIIKEELNKLLEESSKKEKIPMSVPEDWSEEDEYNRRKEVERNLERRAEDYWDGRIDPRYSEEPCPKWIKNRYHNRVRDLRFSTLKKLTTIGFSKKLAILKDEKDATVYFAARIYGCQWAKDLLKKWPDEKFRKFIYRTSLAPAIVAEEAGFHYANDNTRWIEKNFNPDLPRWGLPEAEWQDRREEATGGDEEAHIREVIEDLDARFRERMARDPNWRNELRQYYDLLDNNRFEEFFFALDNEVGQEIFSHMLVTMGDELQEKLQKVTSFMKGNYPTFYKLLQGLDYL